MIAFCKNVPRFFVARIILRTNTKSCIQEKSQILDCADRLNALMLGEVRDVTAHA